MNKYKMYTFLACSVLSLVASGFSVSADDTRMNAGQGKAMMANDADNTRRNMADRDMDTVLPEDQSNDEALLKRTAAIRREIVNRGDLSTQAHNIKIITSADGTTVLRGPVRSAFEKDAVETIARRIAGTAPVKSQIQVEM